MVALITHTRMLAGMLAEKVRARFGEELGQDLIEYAVLGGLIATALIAAAVLGVYTSAVQIMAAGIKDCVDFNSLTDCGIG